MGILYIILTGLVLVICFGVVTMILMQNKRASGLSGSLSGMGASSQTYWDKNKGRSIEGTLETYTKIGGAVIMILSLVLNIYK